MATAEWVTTAASLVPHRECARGDPGPLPDRAGAPQASRFGNSHKARVRSLFLQYRQTRDLGVRDELVDLHLNLVRYVAVRFQSRGEPVTDLIQVGCIGLLKAIERFDTERGTAFTTFAMPTVVGEIKRYFRDSSWSMKVPRALQELKAASTRAIDKFCAEHGRFPTLTELAGVLHVTEEQLIEAQEMGQAQSMLSLECEAESAGKASSPADLLGGLDPGIEEIEDKIATLNLMKCLSKREQLVIFLAFYQKCTQSQIARVLRVSQMQVSRLQTKALKKMQSAARESQFPAGR